MKRNYIFSSVVIALALILFSPFGLQAQNKKNSEKNALPDISLVLERQDFVFTAQSIIPANGYTRQLNGLYDLQITPEKVVSFLPYMGRIYSPILNPDDGPLRFTSKDFVYTEQPQKKGGWSVTIKPKDIRTVREMTLDVSNDGYARLEVNGNDRQSVTFYGYVTANG